MAADRVPLAGRRIVVTRSVDDNRSLVAALGDLGASAIEVPLVEVLAAHDGGRALAEAMARLPDYRWVVLTSVNGVEAVARALGERAWPDGVTVAPVGPSTAAAARSAGMTVGPTPSIATARSLVDEFADWDGTGGRRGRRVLAPLAELASSTVVDGLTAKGYVVDRITAYRTAAPTDGSTWFPDSVESGAEPLAPGTVDTARDLARGVAGADAVAFFSPSAVDRFVQRFEVPCRPPTVVCIGPSTAARAVDHGFDGAITALPHTEAGVIAALVAALAPA